jgi:hypothetical protein
MSASTTATTLIEQIRNDLAPIEEKLAGHEFVTALAPGDDTTNPQEQMSREQQ